MEVRVSKVKAPASQFPRALLFHCDSSCLEPRFPVGQFGGRDSEGEMQFALPVMRRLSLARSSLLEQQQHLMCTCLHGATTLAKLADDAEPKSLLVEANRAREIAHVQ